MTHHYGNWIFAGGFWYWAPPVPRLRAHVRAPLLNIAFAWYPDKGERQESMRIDRRLRPEHEGVRSESRSLITAPAPRIKPPTIKCIFRDTPVAEPKQSRTEARTSAAKRVTGPGGPSAVSAENPRPKAAFDRPGRRESKERQIPRRTGEAVRPEGPKLSPKPVMDRYQGEERSHAQRKIQGPKRTLPSGTRESQMSKVPGIRLNRPEATALSERGQKMSGSRIQRRERERAGPDVQRLGRPGPSIQQQKRAPGCDRKDLETNWQTSNPQQTRKWGAAHQGKRGGGR